MTTFFVIFLIWLTPGLAVFLYLLWVSKRRRPTTGKADAPAMTVPAPQQADEEVPSARKEIAKGS